MTCEGQREVFTSLRKLCKEIDREDDYFNIRRVLIADGVISLDGLEIEKSKLVISKRK